jgi:hypothetical protein
MRMLEVHLFVSSAVLTLNWKQPSLLLELRFCQVLTFNVFRSKKPGNLDVTS